MKGADLDGPLPPGGPDQLVVHLLGPGFGESAVVRFPDGRVMVVDACMRAGVNLPAALLKKLGVQKIDLLVITHPDLDHIRGVAGLLEQFTPTRVWRYPFARSLRDSLIRWTSADSAPAWRRRLRDLREAHEALCSLLQQKNSVQEVGAGHQFWPRSDAGGAYWVKCIAPTDHDQSTLEKRLDAMFSVRAHRVEIDEKLTKQLLGERPVDDHPNTLSVALSVRWGRHRLLFASDVENGNGGPFSGWKGIIDCLLQDDRLDLLEDMSFVKIAHHGSPGAFWKPAWELHATKPASTVAIVTPFHRSTPPLPREETLSQLRPFVSQLGITADARGAFKRAIGAGYQPQGTFSRNVRGIHLSAVFRETGDVSLHAGRAGGLFS